jgi:hypothetical protein
VNSLFAKAMDTRLRARRPPFGLPAEGALGSGKSRLPSKVNAIIETAIKKIYFTAEQPDGAAVIEEIQLKCFNAKKGAACSLLITCGVWVIECLHFARIRVGLPHIPAEDVSKGFNKRLWILSA